MSDTLEFVLVLSLMPTGVVIIDRDEAFAASDFLYFLLQFLALFPGLVSLFPLVLYLYSEGSHLYL